jgi:hypothetical protein
VKGFTDSSAAGNYDFRRDVCLSETVGRTEKDAVMRRNISLVLFLAVSIHLGSNAMGEIAGRAPKPAGGSGTAPDACMRMGGAGTGMQEGASGSPATGMVARVTDTGGRFAVEPVEGEFRHGAEVSVFTPGGDFAGRGTVHNVYGDDPYMDAMDAIDAPGDAIGVGFLVFGNYSGEEARNYALAHQDVLKGMSAEARKELRESEREVAAEYRQASPEREKWQEEMARRKMELGYQHSRYFPMYWGGSYPFYYR